MAVFAIMSAAASPSLRAAVERVYPGKHRHWSEQISFIISPATAQAVAEGLGIRTRNPDGTNTQGISDAIVSQLAPSYWGWTDAEFWSWLTAAHQEAP